MIPTGVGDKIISELCHSEVEDLGRRLVGPTWWPGQKITGVRAQDVVSFLVPAIAGVIGDDRTTGHTARGRYGNFWARTDEGWTPTDVESIVYGLDVVLSSALAEAVATKDALPGTREVARRHYGVDDVDPLQDREEAVRRAQLMNTFQARRDAETFRVELIEAVRKTVTGGSYLRGQFVAALRQHPALDLTPDDKAEAVAYAARVAGTDDAAQLFGMAKRILSP
jgi:hypothetical protein